MSTPLTLGQRIICGGRRWQVRDIDLPKKVIYVAADHGSSPPAFDGGAGAVHDGVRQQMQTVLAESAAAPFIDQQAAALLAEARELYVSRQLAVKSFLAEGSGILLLTC